MTKHTPEQRAAVVEELKRLQREWLAPFVARLAHVEAAQTCASLNQYIESRIRELEAEAAREGE